MVRTLIFAAILMFTSVAQAAELSTTVYMNTNYIYKGLSFTNAGALDRVSAGGPALQGSLDLTHEWFGWTLFTGNVNSFDAQTLAAEQDVEVDSILYVVVPLGPTTMQLKFNNFNYLNNPVNNTLDVAAHVTYQDWKLNLSATRMPGWDTNLGYAQVAYTPVLSENIMLTSHIGYSATDNTGWGYSNYADYKVGAAYMIDGWYTELYYTNTLGRVNYATGRAIDTDAALTLTVAKTFDILTER